jgi:transcription termination factor Rho
MNAGRWSRIMQRSIVADVIYSTFDQKNRRIHSRLPKLFWNEASASLNWVKMSSFLLTAFTRFARASNLVVPASGRPSREGSIPKVCISRKKFFGAARNIERRGGSLTILATSADRNGKPHGWTLIYEEFKGTGNMEVHLERELQKAASSLRSIFFVPEREERFAAQRRRNFKLHYGIRKALNKPRNDQFHRYDHTKYVKNKNQTKILSPLF